MKKLIVFATLLTLIFTHWGCNDKGNGVQSDDTPPADNDTNEVDTSFKGPEAVYIINEGTFNHSNASISLYRPSSGDLTREYYRKQNNYPIGDVLQSVRFYKQKGYLVVNNSGKIEVVDSGNFQSVGVINNLPSPRYLLPTGNNGEAYVSNFTQSGASEISIVDVNAFTKTGKLKTGGWTEQMVKAAGKIWISEVKKGWMLVVDPQDRKVTDTVKLRKEIKSLVKDKNEMIWALANGGINNQLKPVLYQVDPQSKDVVKKMPFPEKAASPSALTINPGGETLYYLNKGIYRVSINAQSLPSKPLVKGKNKNFYGLAVAPGSNVIYASDAKDYVQRGVIYRFDQKGKLLNTFKAGIIPRGFRFFR